MTITMIIAMVDTVQRMIINMVHTKKYKRRKDVQSFTSAKNCLVKSRVAATAAWAAFLLKPLPGRDENRKGSLAHPLALALSARGKTKPNYESSCC